MTVCEYWKLLNRLFFLKIDKIDAQEELANIFDPTTKIYTQTLFLCLVLLGAVVVLGFIYEIIRRRRLATKIKPHGNAWQSSQHQTNKLRGGRITLPCRASTYHDVPQYSICHVLYHVYRTILYHTSTTPYHYTLKRVTRLLSVAIV